MSDASKRKEKRKWAIEKPKLDNGRTLRSVFTSLILMMKNSKTSWRMRVESWKFWCQPHCFANFNVRSFGKPVALKKDCKTKYASIVEADESMRIRMEGSPHKNHEDHLAGKGMNSLSRCNIVQKILPGAYMVALSNENTRCKGSSGERMWKTRENNGTAADGKSETKMRRSLKQGMRAKPYTMHR